MILYSKQLPKLNSSVSLLFFRTINFALLTGWLFALGCVSPAVKYEEPDPLDSNIGTILGSKVSTGGVKSFLALKNTKENAVVYSIDGKKVATFRPGKDSVSVIPGNHDITIYYRFTVPGTSGISIYKNFNLDVEAGHTYQIKFDKDRDPTKEKWWKSAAGRYNIAIWLEDTTTGRIIRPSY